MKNLTFTLCFALLCSVGFAQSTTRKAPEKNNMVKEKPSSIMEEKVKPTNAKYPTKPGVNNQDVNKRAASPSNTMVKEKASSSVEAKKKNSTKPGISNAENRAASPSNKMVKEKPSSSVEVKKKNSTKPVMGNQDVNKRATSPSNTMVKEKAYPTSEPKMKSPAGGVSNAEDREAAKNKNFKPNSPASSKGTSGKTDKKFSPNAPTSTKGNKAPESRALEAAPNTSVSSFCRGWKDGYLKGWVEAKEEATKPSKMPSCPEKVPSGCEDYKCGYSTGMQSGKLDARKR